jgi:hypothetical protein
MLSNADDYHEFKKIKNGKLSQKEPYVFTVTAINPVGSSNPSNTSVDILPNTVPDAPVITKLENVSILKGKQCNVYFNVPSNNGGSPITSYTAIATDFNKNVFSATGTTSPINITGLTNGNSYNVSIKATNSVGDSSSNIYKSQFVPSTTPNPITNLSSVFLNDKISIKFTPPTDNGGSVITNYNIMYGLMTIATTNVINVDSSGNITSTDKNTFTVSDLSKDINGNIVFNLNSTSWLYGVGYTIYITACNSNGCSERISTSITPVKPPDNVTNISATSNEDGKSTIIFTLPSTNTPVVTDFTIVSNPENISQSIIVTNTNSIITGVSSPAKLDTVNKTVTVPFTGLTNGTSYTFTIKTTNLSGLTSSISTTTPIIPGTVPDSPQNLSATPSTNAVNLSFTVPKNNGQPITKYILRPFYTTPTSSTPICDTPVTITDTATLGLTPGSTGNYTFNTNDRTKTFDTSKFPPSTYNFTELKCSGEPYKYVSLKTIKKNIFHINWSVIIFVIIIVLYLIKRYYKRK